MPHVCTHLCLLAEQLEQPPKPCRASTIPKGETLSTPGRGHGMGEPRGVAQDYVLGFPTDAGFTLNQ